MSEKLTEKQVEEKLRLEKRKSLKQKELLNEILKEDAFYDPEEPITKEEYILRAQVRNAMSGDIKSAEFVRDLSGNKPKDEVVLDGKLTLSEALSKIADKEKY